MKVLLVHVRYRQRGGEDTVFDNEVKLLSDNGIAVVPIEFSNDDIREKGLFNKLMLAMNTVWSRKYYKAIAQIIKDEEPDLVHFHNIFPLLSPSVYKACYDSKVPAVQTLHNYRWGCPAGTFFRDGKPCELCINVGLQNSIKYSCYRNSKITSLVVVAMIKFSRWRKLFERYVTKIVVLTNFAKNKMVEAGLPESKMVIKSNFAFTKAERTPTSGSYVLFIGRLSEEKGIKLLAEALVGTLDDIIVKVAGTGPYYDDIKHIIDNNNLKMELLGHMESGALSNIIASSALIVVPSLCYEGFPMVILDAYSHGKPVLVADIGGLSELVVPGVTGEIFRAGSTAALRRALVDVMSDGEKLRIMGKNAYQRYLVNYSELQNISLLRRMYTEAIEAF